MNEYRNQILQCQKNIWEKSIEDKVIVAGFFSTIPAMLSLMKPSTELVPGSHAHTLINGLGLAHFDAHLNDHAVAADILQGDLTELLVNQGISVSMLS